jgi:hypothetical protein
MQTTLLKLPDSLEEDELLRMPATWEEYLDVVDSVPYTVQFVDSELIMSQASRQHESLAIVIAVLLSNYFIIS